uniref:Uncharacterized protein n=1 Tax=Dendroctonus ponderosae TaxID=77166 RepID=A0AAR5PSH4_DENPD
MFTRKNVHLFPCIRQTPTLHSSMPLGPKKRDLLAQTQTTISPIKPEDTELRKSIVQSFGEIKQWSSAAPKFLAVPDNPPKPSKSNGKLHKEIISFNLDDFEDFLSQLNMSSDQADQSSKSHEPPRQSTAFPKQSQKSASSTNDETFSKTDKYLFVNKNRKRKMYSGRSRDDANQQLVDVLLVSFDESKLKSENFSGRFLAEESKSKQLVVNLTRQSLDKLKTQFNQSLPLLTPIVGRNAKACRKFSSNCDKTIPLMKSKSCDSLLLTVKKIDDKRKISTGLSAIEAPKRLDHQLCEASFHNPHASTYETHLDDVVFSSKTAQDSHNSSVQLIENSLSEKPYVSQILLASATDDDLNRLSTPPAKSPTAPRSFDLNNLKSNLLYVLIPRISPQPTTPPPAPQYSAQDLSDVILKTPKLPSTGCSSRTEANSPENLGQNSSIVAEKTESDDFDASGISRFSQKPIIQRGKAWRRSFMTYKQL